MHDVHTLTRCLLPPGRSATRTLWMFGSHRRLVRRWECATDLPKPGAFPQISQTAAIRATPQTLGPTTLRVAGQPRKNSGWRPELPKRSTTGGGRVTRAGAATGWGGAHREAAP